MKAKTGFFQELQGDGSVANSLVRLSVPFFFSLLCFYMYFSNVSYNSQFNNYSEMLKNKNITEQSYIVLTSQLKRFDTTILLILVTATIAPKVLQKIVEAKLGTKDLTEITETSSTSNTKSTTS